MSKYRYETWKNILTKLEFGKEYSVNNTREDYVEFVDALKTFAKHWWNFVVKDHGESTTFVMLDPIKCIDELIFFADKEYEAKKEEPKQDDFYTKSYYPENLEAQRKYWDASNKQERLRRGVNGRRKNDLPKDDPNYTQNNSSPTEPLNKPETKNEETEY